MEHAAHLLHVDHDSIASLPIHHEHNVHRATPSQATRDENVGLVESNEGPLGSRATCALAPPIVAETFAREERLRKPVPKATG